MRRTAPPNEHYYQAPNSCSVDFRTESVKICLMDRALILDLSFNEADQLLDMLDWAIDTIEDSENEPSSAQSAQLDYSVTGEHRQVLEMLKKWGTANEEVIAELESKEGK
ncbi:MAG TPA: hypothetical protein VIY48_21485 [Candidatus Paceibacterota bacterium]